MQSGSNLSVCPSLQCLTQDHHDFLLRLVRHRQERPRSVTILIFQARHRAGEHKRDDPEVVVRPDAAGGACVQHFPLDWGKVVDADGARFVCTARGEDTGLEIEFLGQEAEQSESQGAAGVEEGFERLAVVWQNGWRGPFVREKGVGGVAAVEAFLHEGENGRSVLLL